MLLWQIAFPDHSYVIDASKAPLDQLVPYFADPDWKKIIQNAKFDTKFLLFFNKVRTRNIFDTKIAESLILSDNKWQSTSLKTLAKKYLNIELDKDVRESFINMNPIGAFSSEQVSYAAKDAEILFEIMEAQQEELTRFNLDRIAAIEFELAPIVGDMELVGVPVDVKAWHKNLDNTREKYEQARLRMHEELFDKGGLDEQIGMFERDGINLRSPKQVKEAFHKLGVDVDKTDERTLSLIDHPAAKAMLECREFTKVLDSYGGTFLDRIHPFTGRIHADFQQMGTQTGRFACKNPNLQQMPVEFRECITLKDHKIVGADYANIELRILAELSGDENLTKAFEQGDDPHKSTASLMFNVPLDTVSKEQRFIAKTINFGIAYGMGVNKLMDTLNKDKPVKEKLSNRKVTDLMKRYKDTYGKAIQWLYSAGNTAYRQGYSETMMGRRRWFERPEPNNPDWEQQIAGIKRQGANAPIQGSNADITKLAMLNLYEDLKKYNFKADIILQVHDEITVLAHKSQAEAASEVIKESMTKAAQQVIKSVPVKVDVYVADAWKK
jgi:DNA polymerase-1